jgi:hypothetical protein
MKKLILFLSITMVITVTIYAQAPQAFKYQAIARDEAGNVLSVWDLSLRVSLINEGESGQAVYVESHKVQTNIYGLIHLVIGEGETVKGDFTTIKWGENRHYIKMEMDIDGGTDYKEIGTSQLYAVPYALYADEAGKIAENESNTATSRPQTVKPKSSANNSGGNRNGTPNSKISSSGNSWLNALTGNVGIGTNDPFVNLDIRSSSTASASRMLLGNSDNSTNLFLYSGHETEDPYISFLGGDALRFTFYDGEVHELVRIQSDGKVGIGTTTPSGIIHASGGPSPKYILAGNSQTAGNTTTLFLSHVTSHTNNKVAIISEAKGSNGRGKLHFATTQKVSMGNVGVNDARMTITDDGKVGIGTTAPAGILDIAGAYHFPDTDGTSGQVLQTDGSGTISWEDRGTPYSVGDFAQGGIVFWVDETGQHGLVCAKGDQDGGSGIQWYNGTYTNTEAHGDGVYAGEMNTMLIIANQGSNSNDYAAGVCAKLTVTEGGKTYGDWYLPSKLELNLMYQKKAMIDATAVANGGSAFASTYYWSSSEYLSGFAWRQSFVNGIQGYELKSYTGRVRAVRAF